MTRLNERRTAYSIPDLPYLPMGKVVLVFRMPSAEKSAGGIYIPETDREPKPIGVLLAAGLQALDVLRDHLVEIGDIVWFGKFAGWEHEVKRIAEGKGEQVLQLKVDDILGSVDALERMGSSHALGFDDQEGEHYYEERKRNGNGTRNHRV
jgi:chaperonin GroES